MLNICQDGSLCCGQNIMHRRLLTACRPSKDSPAKRQKTGSKSGSPQTGKSPGSRLANGHTPVDPQQAAEEARQRLIDTGNDWIDRHVIPAINAQVSLHTCWTPARHSIPAHMLD